MAQGCSFSDVLDVLVHLPITMLRDTFWPQLDAADHADFRLTCRRAQQLAEQLTSCFTINFTRHTEPHSEDSNAALEELEPPLLHLLGTCLSRHEHIELLHLLAPAEEAHILEALQLGGSACRRVAELQLHNSSCEVAAAAGDALLLACPRLHTLTMTGAGRLCVPFAAALQGLQLLTTVRLTDTTATSLAMDALATLPGLTAFECVGRESFVRPDAPQRLSALTALQTLRLGGALLDDPKVLRSLGTLTALSRLTCLSLASPYLTDPHADSASEAAIVAAARVLLVQLGAMHRLVSLRVGQMASFVDGPTFAALAHLTRLTALHVNCVALQGPAPAPTGALSQLQELHLHLWMVGGGCLRSLQPLLPLRCLTHVTLAVLVSGLQLAQALAASLVALRQAAQHLAAAPALQSVHLALVGHTANGSRDQLGCALMALEPLRPWLRRLQLSKCSCRQLYALCGGLLRPLDRLVELRLWKCAVDGAVLMDVSHDGVALRRLEVYCCPGATAALATAVVTARVQPLRVEWSLEPAEAAVIQVALRALSKRHVTLVGCEVERFW